MNEDLALLADGNSSAARRLRVKEQPRDKGGQWIPTGAELVADIADIGSVKGKAIGGTATEKGQPNKVRMLVGPGYEKQGIPANTVIEVESKNAKLETGIKLSRDYLKSKGIDPDLKNELPADVADLPQRLEDMNPQPADQLDIELANSGLTDEEDKDFRAERDAEPLAKLTPGQAGEALTPAEIDALTNPKASQRFIGKFDGGVPKVPTGRPLTVAEMTDRALVEASLKEMTKASRSDGKIGTNVRRDIDAELEKRGINPISYGTPGDVAVEDAVSSAFFGGDVPPVEKLVNAAKAPASSSEAVGFGDLTKGDIVVVRGTPMRFDRAAKRNNGNWDVYVDPGTGQGPLNLASPKLFPNGIPDGTLGRIKKADAVAPATTPATTPTVDATPDTSAPNTPATPKKVSKPAAKPTKTKKNKAAPPANVSPVVPAGREDDGSDIVAPNVPTGEMQDVKISPLIDPNTGKPLFHLSKNGQPTKRKIEDPNAIYNQLLESYPDAKVDSTGAIVLERGTFTDTDGQNLKYEVAVAKTFGNQYLERYKITKADGTEMSFYYHDLKDSFAALHGDRNGVITFRDQLLGKVTPPGAQPREIDAYFATGKGIEDRLRYFRGKRAKGNEPTVEDMTDPKKQVRLLTPEEMVSKYLLGRGEVYNLSGEARGTKLASFVGNTWEAIEADDSETFKARIIQVLGHLPNSVASRELLINTLRNGIKEKFNGTQTGRKNATLANNLSKWIQSEGFDLKDVENRPWTSRDGNTIVEVGDKVRYWNTIGEWSIGTVVKRIGVRNGKYDDALRVEFADGKTGLVRSDRIDVLGETDPWLNEHTFDSEPSEYKPNPKGQELRDARGFTYDFGNQALLDEEQNGAPDGSVINDTPQDPAAPNIGTDGVSGEEVAAEADATPAAPEGNVADFEPGDIWTDENGDKLGTFIEANKDEADDGTPIWVVYYLKDNGDEEVEYIEIDSVRSPK